MFGLTLYFFLSKLLCERLTVFPQSLRLLVTILEAKPKGISLKFCVWFSSTSLISSKSINIYLGVSIMICWALSPPTPTTFGWQESLCSSLLSMASPSSTIFLQSVSVIHCSILQFSSCGVLRDLFWQLGYQTQTRFFQVPCSFWLLDLQKKRWELLPRYCRSLQTFSTGKTNCSFLSKQPIIWFVLLYTSFQLAPIVSQFQWAFPLLLCLQEFICKVCFLHRPCSWRSRWI